MKDYTNFRIYRFLEYSHHWNNMIGVYVFFIFQLLLLGVDLIRHNKLWVNSYF
jgi:hypothetical protein